MPAHQFVLLVFEGMLYSQMAQPTPAMDSRQKIFAVGQNNFMKYIIVALGLAVLNININAQDTLPNYNADTKALADILVNIIKEQNVGGGEYLYINARDGNITYKFLNRIVLNIE